ncbi:unnamed protein product [Fraxinus pennsylvanica]|uniref:Uncharacterized protein n=1 Tax=Fraxinus pennsylvanica TaxID=56036 RepID=A0AAD2DY23_9LAMI|nr:unnamed protein product [Fraxinus pennsylvanica]
MTGLKRKVTDENNHSREKGREFKNRKRNNSSSRTKGKEQNRPRRGPRLPNALQKELNLLNPAVERGFSDGDEDINFGDIVGNDVYEYEEGIPEEESKKNKRFDPVDNNEYELPEDFEDENVASDEGEDDENEDNQKEDDNEEDEGRHARMLQDITGLPSSAFDGLFKRLILYWEALPVRLSCTSSL